MSLLWHLNRLRAMGPVEISCRLLQVFQSRLEWLGVGLAKPYSPSSDFGKSWLRSIPKDIDPEPYVAAADAVLAGQFEVFALAELQLGFPPQWNRDPKSGTVAPMVFGKTLDYRDERLVGDIKYLWELNRHLELVTLAQAWVLTRDPRYTVGCRVLLDSWFEQCPYPWGPNWTSSLEQGVRLVNWAVAWHLLEGDRSPLFSGEEGSAFRRRWLDSVFQHCHFIAGHFSRHSSANNHLLGEYMGLFIGTVTWPVWSESRDWLARAHQGLEDEALEQNASDGVNREQAIWYHHEVADMMLLCGLFGRANGIEFCPEFWRRLEAMHDFLAAVMDVSGNVPMIGDSDNAVMVRFSREEGFNVYRSLLASGAALFERAGFKRAAGRFDDKSRWLLGDAGAQIFARLLQPAAGADTGRRSFRESGYFVLGDRLGTAAEVRIVADAGPLGYRSIAAHGHADALAFTLCVRGQEILIDPGTYAYHTQRKWRDYFRGTGAHNTVRVDGMDQSVAGGSFLWLRHAGAWCEDFEFTDTIDRLAAWHDGYRRLKDPVTHRRESILDKSARRLLVTDRIECSGVHTLERSWHFSETCRCEVAGGNVRITSAGVVVEMRDLDGGSVERLLFRGSEEPPCGWVSRTFDVKVPTTTICWRGTISGDRILRTEFRY